MPTGQVMAYVNGERFSRDPAEILLEAHELIQLDVAGDTMPPRPFTFPPGVQVKGPTGTQSFDRSVAVAMARESVDALVTRVVLLDSPLAVRQALGLRLSLEADVSIVGEADDAAQALGLLDSVRPEVVLVDAETPDLDCASVVRSLAQHDPQLGIVVLSVHTAAVRHMLDGTPAHVVGKHERIPALVAAIHAAPRPRHSSEPGPREA